MLLRSSEMLLQQIPSTLTIIHSYLLLWEWVPPSLNPLAKGLWSIFNLVIFKNKETKQVAVSQCLCMTQTASVSGWCFLFVPLGSGKRSPRWRWSPGRRRSGRGPSGRCKDCLPGSHETWGSSGAWSAGWSDGSRVERWTEGKMNIWTVTVWIVGSHVAVLVQRVVGELHLQEGQRLLHPVASWGGGVRVHVCPTRGLGLRLACHLPLLLFPLQRNGGGRDVSVFDQKSSCSMKTSFLSFCWFFVRKIFFLRSASSSSPPLNPPWMRSYRTPPLLCVFSSVC